MIAIEAILDRLCVAKRSGAGWRARCPSCGGSGQKLSVAEGDGGRILIHCFGGCGPLLILQSLGLNVGDLFPERLTDDTPDARRKLRRAIREAQWGAALDVLDVEGGVILIAGRQIATGTPLCRDDSARLTKAVRSVASARNVLRESFRYRPKVAP